MAVRAVACGLVFAAACSFAGFGAKCDGIRSSVLRMHIIANSDEAKDQELKLFVRDRLLAVSPEVFDGCISEADAEAAAEKNINLLQRTAEDAIRDFGSKARSPCRWATRGSQTGSMMILHCLPGPTRPSVW